MSIFIGNSEIKNAYIGTTPVKEIYVGTTKVRPTSRLPSAYQEVEYIQSSGTQYIDSLYTPNDNTKIACKFIHTANQDTPMFGGRRTGTANQTILWSHTSGYSSSGIWVLLNAMNNVSGTPGYINTVPPKPKGTIIEFEYDKNGGKYNNYTWTWSLSSSGSGVNMLIFALREGSSIDSRKTSAKLFYFKIWDNGTLVRDLVPCYRKSDSVIGMYDLVNNRFYTNSGSGIFSKGPDVN